MAYIGNDLQVAQSIYKIIDDISSGFNGSTTTFPLTVNGIAPIPFPISNQQCLITVGGVPQKPDLSGADGFNISGTNIVFSSAPSTGEKFWGVILAGADYVNAGGSFPNGSAITPSITFDNNLNTGFYLVATNTIGVSINGVNKIVVDSNGRLGIGNASPGTLLDVSGVVTGQSFIPTSSTIPTNGVYLPAANNLAFATNSVGRIFIDGSGNVGISTASPLDLLHAESNANSNQGFFARNTSTGSSASSHFVLNSDAGQLIGRAHSVANSTWPATGVLQSSSGLTGGLVLNTATTAPIRFFINSLEYSRIDSAGRSLIGATSARAISGVTGKLQIEGTTDAYAPVVANRADAIGPGLLLAKTRGTVVGANTIVQTDDQLGQLRFYGADGTAPVEAASILAYVDGTPGVSNMPGRLVLSTTASGASTPTARITVYNNGRSIFANCSLGTPTALTDAATIAVDLAVANHFTVTLGGNRTLGTPTNVSAGQSGVIVITQDGTGSRTLAYNSIWKFPSAVAPVLTTTASAVDILAYYVESPTRISARLISDMR